MSTLNKIRDAFGKFPLEQTSPMTALKKEKFNKQLMIGIGLGAFALGAFVAYRWIHKDDVDPGTINWSAVRNNPSDHSFAGGLKKRGKVQIKDDNEDNVEDGEMDIPEELSGMSETRKKHYLKYMQSRYDKKA